MTWLDALKTQVLALGGHTANVTYGDAAVQFAAGIITSATGIEFGTSKIVTQRVVLEARSYLLPLHRYTLTVTGVEPTLASGSTWILGDCGLELERDGQPAMWGPGAWRVTGSIGSPDVPQDVIKAASLLAAYYLDLSDPDRSRYVSLSLGDFAGTMRLHQIPVPEAAALIAHYRDRVAVSA